MPPELVRCDRSTLERSKEHRLGAQARTRPRQERTRQSLHEHPTTVARQGTQCSPASGAGVSGGATQLAGVPNDGYALVESRQNALVYDVPPGWAYPSARRAAYKSRSTQIWVAWWLTSLRAPATKKVAECSGPGGPMTHSPSFMGALAYV